MNKKTDGNTSKYYQEENRMRKVYVPKWAQILIDLYMSGSENETKYEMVRS